MKVDPSRLPIEGIGQTGRVAPRQETAKAGETGFDRILRERVTGLKFSGHAEERIARRGMALGVEELERLKSGVDRARAKGAKDSLVLVDDKAFVVSVQNRTVITALSGEAIREGVFTNIDSAVVA